MATEAYSQAFGIFKIEGSRPDGHREPVALFQQRTQCGAMLGHSEYPANVLNFISVELTQCLSVSKGSVMPYKDLFLADLTDAEVAAHDSLLKKTREEKLSALQPYRVEDPKPPTKCPYCDFESANGYAGLKMHIFSGKAQKTPRGRIIKSRNCVINDKFKIFLDACGFKCHLAGYSHLRGAGFHVFGWGDDEL